MSPAPGGARVRVVVVNWNSAWYTRRCLEALRHTEHHGSLEVVVVDNGSVDGSLEQLRHGFPEVRFVANRDNLGFAEGCNRALRDLDGVDHVALLNNDAVADPDWLRPLLGALEADPRAGAAAAAMVLEPGFATVHLSVDGHAVLERVEVDGIDVTSRIRHRGVRVEPLPEWPMHHTLHLEGPAELLVPAGEGARAVTLGLSGRGAASADAGAGEVSVPLGAAGGADALTVVTSTERTELLNGLGTELDEHLEGFDLRFGEPVGELDDLVPHVVTGFCGGAVLLRGAMLREVGCFDPRLFAYYEDVDLAWRARRAGWHTVAVPSSRVRHALGGSGGARSGAFFHLNHRNWLLTAVGNADGPRARATVRNALARWKYALTTNVVHRLRERRRPALDLPLAWTRVLVAVALGAPGARWRRRRGARFDRPTTRVRSALQPRPSPPRPSSRPGGPRILVVETGSATELRHDSPGALVLRRALRWPSFDVVPVTTDADGSLRRLSPRESARLLGVAPGVTEDRDPLPYGPDEHCVVVRFAAANRGIRSRPGGPLEVVVDPARLAGDGAEEAADEVLRDVLERVGTP